MKNAKKTFFVFLFVALLTAIMHTNALAYSENETISTADDFIFNEEAGLSSLYVASTPDSENRVFEDSYHSFLDRPSGVDFNELEQAIYNELKSKIFSISNGSLSSTQFTITSDISSLSWTKEELNCAILSNGLITTTAKHRVETNLKEAIDISYIIQCLLADCPYELFWFDKTTGVSYNYNMRGTTGQLFITSLTFDFHISEAYRSAATADYEVDLNKISRANSVISAAQIIVAKYEDKSDYEKLQAYRDEICSLVSYNNDAASGNCAYGDPWQLIYVFDGDPNTNVVCEGYSKAFKYLCDLSNFSKDIYCYIVGGTISVDGTTGNHMWNVVKINNTNYLVDITNYDLATTSTAASFFLSGASSSVSGKSHVLQIGTSNSPRTVVYTYKNNQNNLFCDGFLILSKISYHEHHFSSEWSSDNMQHWHECTCGDKTDMTVHIPLLDATCTQKSICGVCEAAYGELLDHIYDQQIMTENYLISSATCTTKATYYFSCSCGATGSNVFEGDILVEHSYNAFGICSICGSASESKSPVLEENLGNNSDFSDDTESSYNDVMTDNDGPTNPDESLDNSVTDSHKAKKFWDLLADIFWTILKFLLGIRV